MTEKLNILASLFAQAASALMFEHDEKLGATQIKFKAEVQRSGEACLELGIGTDRPVSHDLPRRPDCDDKPRVKKPCPHEAEEKAKSKIDKPSSALNDALNNLAAEVDERNKSKE